MKNKYGHLNLPSGSLRIAVTNKCNMNCFYCHNEGQPKIPQEDLKYEDFIKIIKIAKRFGLRGVSFTGGEPFLNKDLGKMINFVIKEKLEKIDICSNGILIKENINLLKKSKAISLAIGIDTCQKDKISKQSNSGVNFETIEKNLFLMRKNDIQFSMNVVYTHENKVEISKLIRYCACNKIALRVIEIDTKKKLTEDSSAKNFRKFTENMISKFNLKKAFAYPVNDIYCKHPNGQEIFFYNAKCHERKCDECAKWTLRINSLGEAIPCYAKKDKYPILSRDENQADDNFLKSIYNLGIPPERKKIKW